MNVSTHRTLAAASLIATALITSACEHESEPIATIDWSRTIPERGQVIDGAVRVTAPAEGGTFPLATVERPAVPADGYRISGEVRYEGVEGEAFLEMWSTFPDGERYFSRTQGEGPQEPMSGASGWRPVELPFVLSGGQGPVRIAIDVVLPGAGTVDVGELEVLPLSSDGGAWWSERTAGLVGGIGGAFIGTLGGLIGWLSSRGRARAFVLGAMRAAVVIGVALLAVAGVAILSSQPYTVVYPIAMAGVILAVVFGGVLPGVQRSYAARELQRMRALDQS